MSSQAAGPDEAADPRVAFFDACAPTWDQTGPDAAAGIRWMEALRPVLHVVAGCDVLEVGCGTGQLTRWLVEAVRPGGVTAIDFSPKMIAGAAAKGIDAAFRCQDVCADDLGEGLYDLALCYHSFPHFRDQAAALRNMARALKPAGLLAVVHLSGSEHVNHFHHSVGGPVGGDRLPRREQWDALLAPAGLTRRELRDGQDGFLLVARRRNADGG